MRNAKKGRKLNSILRTKITVSSRKKKKDTFIIAFNSCLERNQSRRGKRGRARCAWLSRSIPEPQMPAALPGTEGPGSAAGSAYLGRLPQHPFGHRRPVHLGYPPQRGQGSRYVSRGDVVPRRLRDELKAERHQKAFLHLPIHQPYPQPSVVPRSPARVAQGTA